MYPRLVLSDPKGNIFIHPELSMAAFDGRRFCLPSLDAFVSLPKGSTLFYLPAHAAIGYEKGPQNFLRIQEWADQFVFPVAAFPVPGYTRSHLPAAEKKDKKIILPLWPYTAVGWHKGRFVITAFKIDPLRRQMPSYYKEGALLNKNIGEALKKFPKNRLFRHLSHCAVKYNCRNAQNLFLKRWEAPLPVSSVCNARCLGCLSYQKEECGTASHERISFVPTAREVSQVGISHLKNAKEPIVSFGQGCEGEPLLQFPVLKEAIRLMREATPRGTIHLNTNGFDPRLVKELAQTGLDSIRVSVNSLDEKKYAFYYRPRHYGLNDVLAAVRQAQKSGLFVSLNLLTFPGLTDTIEEAGRLVVFLKKGYVDLLQMRNLSIDPEYILRKIRTQNGPTLGIQRLAALIKKRCPGVRLGYFNIPKHKFRNT
jgi:pyruvate-formate lyase-activating enzyme